jgi:hypothetical protein
MTHGPGQEALVCCLSWQADDADRQTPPPPPGAALACTVSRSLPQGTAITYMMHDTFLPSSSPFS